ncbi:hypothetical protein [Sphingobium amiense]
MPRLKVFRTPIGFHDAYVAAPSRKPRSKHGVRRPTCSRAARRNR